MWAFHVFVSLVSFSAMAVIEVAESKTIVVDWYVPSVNEKLPNYTAQVGDTALFLWEGQHNVYVHPGVASTVVSCANAAVGDSPATAVAWTGDVMGGSAEYIFTSRDIGNTAFTCQVGSHCALGQKVLFTVEQPPSAAEECRESIRIRRDWDLITQAEQELYIQALEKSVELGYYQRFVAYHADRPSSIQAHESCAFPFWHRRFLLAFETMLRFLDDRFSCLTVPYWNVMEHYRGQTMGHCSSYASCSAIVSRLGGTPVNHGVTRVYFGIESEGEEDALFTGRPIQDIRDDQGRSGIVRWDPFDVPIPPETSYNAVREIWRAGKSNFTAVAEKIQKGIHDFVHDSLGGFMPTYSSPIDPLFPSWHSTIDLLFLMWEKCHVPSPEAVTSLSRLSTCDDTQATNTTNSHWAFPENFTSCSRTSRAQQQFPLVKDATAELHMKEHGSVRDIRDDPLTGQFFTDLGIRMVDFAAVESLPPSYQFTYDHLTDQLWDYLQDPVDCPLALEHDWTAFPTTPPAPAPASPIPSDARSIFLAAVRQALTQLADNDQQLVNRQMRAVVCHLDREVDNVNLAQLLTQKDAAEFATELVTGNVSMLGSTCLLLWPSQDDEGSHASGTSPSPTKNPASSVSSPSDAARCGVATMLVLVLSALMLV